MALPFSRASFRRKPDVPVQSPQGVSEEAAYFLITLQQVPAHQGVRDGGHHGITKVAWAVQDGAPTGGTDFKRIRQAGKIEAPGLQPPQGQGGALKKEKTQEGRMFRTEVFEKFPVVGHLAGSWNAG